MKKIYVFSAVMLLAILAFAQPPEATTVVSQFISADGLQGWAEFFIKSTVAADSADIYDETITWSNPIYISPYTGSNGASKATLDLYVNAPDSDSVAVKYHYQLANKTAATKFWTTIEISDSVYLENTLTTMYIELDTLGSYRYLRCGVQPIMNADSTFVCDDNIEAYGWFVGNLNTDYFNFDFDPKITTKELFDDGHSYRVEDGKEYK